MYPTLRVVASAAWEALNKDIGGVWYTPFIGGGARMIGIPGSAERMRRISSVRLEACKAAVKPSAWSFADNMMTTSVGCKAAICVSQMPGFGLIQSELLDPEEPKT